MFATFIQIITRNLVKSCEICQKLISKKNSLRRNFYRIDRADTVDGIPTLINYSEKRYELSGNTFTMNTSIVSEEGTYKLLIKCNETIGRVTNWVAKVEYIELKNQYSTNISNITYPVNKTGYIETTVPEVEVFPPNSKITADFDNGIFNSEPPEAVK